VKKFIVVTSLFLSFIFSAERAYGFGGEKFPLSFISISGSAHINAHQEIFVAVGSVIFGGGFSVGYKQYKNQASQSSLYASICLHTGIYGDMGHKITAIYPAIGYSLMLSKKVNLNIGGGCHLALKNIGNEFDGKRIFWTPFLNLTFKM